MSENKNEISDLTVIALVTSVLIAPVGWFLGFRARKQIEANGGYGRPFATAAIWIGGILTVGFLAMSGLCVAGAALNNGHDHGFGYRNHMSFGDRGQGGFGNGLDRGNGMMQFPFDNQNQNQTPTPAPSPTTKTN
jgi:hypothetical protein